MSAAPASANPTPPAAPWPRQWRRPPRIIRSRAVRWLVALAVVGYLTLAIGSLDVNWHRVQEGLGRGWRFVQAFLAPDFHSRFEDIAQGLYESLTMTVTSTLVGLVLAVPLGLGAARNLAPRPIYLLCRALVMTARALQEIVVAILFVALVGFGPLAGFLTLTVATVGFLGKLLADAVEDIDPAPLDAIRATGAGWRQRVDYAVIPQVLPRALGLVLYRVDINFRESAVIGIVGAGGIGATLNTAMDRYEYPVAAAVLLLIIVIVFACEIVSGALRARVR